LYAVVQTFPGSRTRVAPKIAFIHLSMWFAYWYPLASDPLNPLPAKGMMTRSPPRRVT
jgi:hypothetical protein